MKLRLLEVGFDRVRFYAVTRDESRFVTVSFRGGGGADWYRAAAFPHGGTDEGRSLGDPNLDEEVRRRASEELVRLEAAVDIAERRLVA